ncbi:unnamed protein product [Leuciscus chuanchicus]
MATASTSGQSPFGLGRKKKAPGLLDQIGRAHFVVIYPPLHRDPTTLPPVVVEMSTLWCISSGALCPLLVPSQGGEKYWAWLPRQRVARRALDRLTDAEENRIHSPESSTWEKADLALHPNAGAPSSEPFADQKNIKMEESETDEKQKPEREDLCPINSQVAASLTN